MLFNSFVFLFLFLPIVYLVFWTFRSAQFRYFWLTVSGYVFYGYWDARFCLLMAFSTLVSYLAGLGMLTFPGARSRKALLVIPIAVDLLLLGYFKYATFAMQSVNDVSSWLGAPLQLSVFHVVLPVGISFYTFHTITYIVDSYRGVIQPTRNLFEFSAYVALFPQLVAGPIVRFREIEADLEALGKAAPWRWAPLGMSFFVFGLAEKVLIADSLAGFVNDAYANVQALGSLGAWLAALAYTFQLYFDFSGYSTMAVGLGCLFGLRIPQNFNSPYRATDPADFWRRWHISLSTCLRDYLYIPLGGNRYGTMATYRNLLITMLLGGVWHGANWTFVLWGLYHGILLCLHRANASAWKRLAPAVQWVITFVAVVFGWVLFRAASIQEAYAVLTRMLTWRPGIGIEHAEWLVVALVIASWLAIEGKNAFEWHANFRMTAANALFLCILFGACLAMIAADRNSPFLYFQF